MLQNIRESCLNLFHKQETKKKVVCSFNSSIGDKGRGIDGDDGHGTNGNSTLVSTGVSRKGFPSSSIGSSVGGTDKFASRK